MKTEKEIRKRMLDTITIGIDMKDDYPSEALVSLGALKAFAWVLG